MVTESTNVSLPGFLFLHWDIWINAKADGLKTPESPEHKGSQLKLPAKINLFGGFIEVKMNNHLSLHLDFHT